MFDPTVAAEIERIRTRRLAVIDTAVYRDLKLNKKL
jgi:hypothetical protein